MRRASAGSAPRRCSTASAGFNGKPVGPPEERGLPGRAFDCQHANLRRDAAASGEAARLAARGEDAVARDDDGERISPEGLADRAGRAGRADPRRDLAVRERRARTDPARLDVNALVERRHALHVELHGREVARLAAQQRPDAVDGVPRGRRRPPLARLGESSCHPRARRVVVALRQPDAGHALLAPGDTAAADRRIEEREPLLRHDRDVSLPSPSRLLRGLPRQATEDLTLLSAS